MGDKKLDFGEIGFNFENIIQQNVKLIRSFGPLLENVQEAFKVISPIAEAFMDINGAFQVVTQNANQFINPGLLTERIYRDCLSNAKYGWCMSAHMTISGYRKIAKEADSQEIRDKLFINEFEEDDYDLYKRERSYIISSAQEGWQDFYEECFYLIDNQKYKAVVPSLVSAIEHELCYEQTNDIGKRLIRRVQSTLVANGDSDSFVYAISTSVLNLLCNIVFEYREFNEDRLPLINRNWVLHGRDTPSFWNKEDVYKLITMISALRMLNEWNSIEWSCNSGDEL